jgi:hypothetical protein
VEGQAVTEKTKVWAATNEDGTITAYRQAPGEEAVTLFHGTPSPLKMTEPPPPAIASLVDLLPTVEDGAESSEPGFGKVTQEKIEELRRLSRLPRSQSPNSDRGGRPYVGD